MPIPVLTNVKFSVATSKGSLSFLLFILLVTVIQVASGFDGSGTLAVLVGYVEGLLVALKLTQTPKGSIILSSIIFPSGYCSWCEATIVVVFVPSSVVLPFQKSKLSSSSGPSATKKL